MIPCANPKAQYLSNQEEINSAIQNVLDSGWYILGKEVENLDAVTVACIGPVTAKAAMELNIRVDVVASKHTVEGLIDALASHFVNGRGQP